MRYCIRYVHPDNETDRFFLISTIGQGLYDFILLGGKASYIFSIKDLKPGVYSYKLVVSGNGVDTGKLVIVR